MEQEGRWEKGRKDGGVERGRWEKGRKDEGVERGNVEVYLVCVVPKQ